MLMVTDRIDIAELRLEFSINKTQFDNMQIESRALNVNSEPETLVFKKEAQNNAVTESQTMTMICDVDTKFRDQKANFDQLNSNF